MTNLSNLLTPFLGIDYPPTAVDGGLRLISTDCIKIKQTLWTVVDFKLVVDVRIGIKRRQSQRIK